MAPGPRPQPRCPGKGPSRRGAGSPPWGDAPGRQCGVEAGGQSPDRPLGRLTPRLLPPFSVEESGPQAYEEAQAMAPCVSRPASEIGSLPHSRRKKPTQGPFLENTSRVTLQPGTQLQTGALCAWSRLPRGPSVSTGSGVHPRTRNDAEGRSARGDDALNSRQGGSLPTPHPGRAELARPWGPAPSTCCVSPDLRLGSTAMRTDVLSRARTVLGCAVMFSSSGGARTQTQNPGGRQSPVLGPQAWLAPLPGVLEEAGRQNPVSHPSPSLCRAPPWSPSHASRRHSDPLTSSLKVRVIPGAPAPGTPPTRGPQVPSVL